MIRLMTTQGWTLIVALALVLGFGQKASAHPLADTDPVAVVTAFEAMVGNASQVDAALALWAENGVQKVIPAPQGTTGVWTGQAELRQGFQYAVANKVQRQIVGTPQVTGSTVTYASLASNTAFVALGVAPVKFTTVVVVENGKITSYINTMDPAEGPRVGAAATAHVLVAFEQMVGNPSATDAALALWADHGVQTITPAPAGTTGQWTGQAELRQAFDYAAAHQVKRELVGSPQVAGNKVTYVALATNDMFLLWGVAPVQFNTEAEVENGKIVAYHTSIVPSEGARVGAAAAAYQAAHAAPPVGMPATGGNTLPLILTGLLGSALLCLLAGVFARRTRARG